MTGQYELSFYQTCKGGIREKGFFPYRRRLASCERRGNIKGEPYGFPLKELRSGPEQSEGEAEATDLVSACLAGISCRWDGRNCLRDEIQKLVAEGKAIAICPEEQGGLPTPRPPAEIVGGDGEDVLDGRAKVVNKFGRDLTKQFIKGARHVLRLAKKIKAKRVILKARSTSCGLNQIYDGTFSHKLRKGSGVTCAALRRAGIEVVTDELFEVKGS